MLSRKTKQKCLINNIKKECIVDLGSDCSIIRASEAQMLNLNFTDCEDNLIAFNKTAVLPLGRTQVNIKTDQANLNLDFLIVEVDDKLSYKILVGRNILITPGIKATADANGIYIVREEQNNSENKSVFSVNCVESRLRIPIVIEQIYAPELNEGNKNRLLKLLNDYQDNVTVKGENEFTRALVDEMKIELTNSEPV